MPLEKNEKPWTNKKNNKNGMISEGRFHRFTRPTTYFSTCCRKLYDTTTVIDGL
jgi:hypothetical protein